MFRPFIKKANSAVTLVIKRSAGHSKWQNIRHIKALKDTQRSLLINRLGQKIKVAIQENSNNSDPETNFQLAQAIDNAKRNSIPAATIQSFLKFNKTDKDQLQAQWLTVKGLKGTLLLVSALSSNFKKTKYEVAAIIKKNGGSYADGARGLFDHKGIIVAIPPSDLENATDVAVDHAIEAGAEEVMPVEDSENNSLQFTCDVNQFSKAKAKLIELKYTIQETDLIYVAKNSVNLSDEDMEAVSKLIEKIEAHPDVVCVYDNIA